MLEPLRPLREASLDGGRRRVLADLKPDAGLRNGVGDLGPTGPTAVTWGAIGNFQVGVLQALHRYTKHLRIE